MLRFAVLTALLILTALPAHADPATEARLRGVIEGLIAAQKTAFEKTGGSFVTNGTVMIEKADSYYAVTLPDITLIHPNKSRTALGLIALNASPAGRSKWNITMALPTPIVTKDANGAVQSELALGKQHFTGLWDEGMKNFSTLKTIYENVRLNLPQQTPPRPFTSATLKKLGYGFDLSNRREDKTDLTFRLGLEGLAAQGIKPAYARLFPTDATINVDMKDVPLDKLTEIQKDLLTPDKSASPSWIALLGKAGSETVINKVELKNSHTALQLSGHVKPAPDSPLKQTGKLTLDVSRIDQILTGLQEITATLPAADQAKVQTLRAALTMMAALGNDRGDVKRYDVDMTPEGKIMLNGADFTAVLGPLLTPADKTASR